MENKKQQILQHICKPSWDLAHYISWSKSVHVEHRSSGVVSESRIDPEQIVPSNIDLEN